MRRRLFLASVAAALVVAQSLAAETIADRIERQLHAQGFNQITVTRTWLGRTRIVATSPTHQREIILNPRTGEILRDFWQSESDGEDDNAPLIDSESSDDDAAMGGGGQSGGGDSGGEAEGGGEGGGGEGGSDD